ncbi:hypothetical protein Tagg_0264 [Thermosphaera aggregans DSM 11486]|uniref:Uncharacterized protein n=1 Tax=Thermosphaera aggregans (strain DSM 11486 / M11TL) TaxID=633148 RepID=D5U092_THEAM|nr:hypothetical protein Tagg_0264 [Thermosphaera aggregans DSM 11486]
MAITDAGITYLDADLDMGTPISPLLKVHNKYF